MKSLRIALICASAVAAANAHASPALSLVKTIALPEVRGGFNHHAVDGRRQRAYLCCRDNNSVEVVALDSGRIVKSLTGTRPSAVCFVASADLVCVSRGREVQLYNAETLTQAASVPLATAIDEMHDEGGSARLVVGCMTAPDQGIGGIDLQKRQALPIIRIRAGLQGFALEEDGPRVFVSTPSAGGMTVVDRRRGALSRWPLPAGQSAHPVAFDARAHRLLVGCRQPAQLVVFDTDGGRIVASVEIGGDTDDLNWDAQRRRVYVACGEGKISVIQQDDPDHYRNIQTLPTVPGARNCAYVPETGQFLVTLPQRPGSPAELRVYQAR